MVTKMSMMNKSVCRADPKKTTAVEDEIRDIINLIAVFEKEYDLDAEVVKTLRKKLEKIAKMVGNL